MNRVHAPSFACEAAHVNRVLIVRPENVPFLPFPGSSRPKEGVGTE